MDDHIGGTSDDVTRGSPVEMAQSDPGLNTIGSNEASVLAKTNQLLSTMGLDPFQDFSDVKQLASPMFVGIIENLLMTQFEGVSRRPKNRDEHVQNLRIAIEHLSSFLSGDLFRLLDPEAINNGDIGQISNLVDILYELHGLVVQAPDADGREPAVEEGSHGVSAQQEGDSNVSAEGETFEQKEKNLAQRHDQRRQRQEQRQLQKYKDRSAPASGGDGAGSVEENNSQQIPPHDDENASVQLPPAAQADLLGVVVEELRNRDPALLREIVSGIKDGRRLRQFNQPRRPPDPYIDEAAAVGLDLDENGAGRTHAHYALNGDNDGFRAEGVARGGGRSDPDNVIFSTTMELRREVHDRAAQSRRQHHLEMKSAKHRRRNLQHIERVMDIKGQRFMEDIANLQRKQRVTRESLEAQRTKALFKALIAQKRNDLVYQRKQQQLILRQTRQEVASVQERLKNFYQSQAELLQDQMREEDQVRLPRQLFCTHGQCGHVFYCVSLSPYICGIRVLCLCVGLSAPPAA
eukprot:INCI16043.3.p1 GENE.INCI16043.3~~INCI16043.3.p1  ORF type:complete len:520 (-),score=109.83 INCI16043.3:801-2360(-)